MFSLHWNFQNSDSQFCKCVTNLTNVNTRLELIMAGKSCKKYFIDFFCHCWPFLLSVESAFVTWNVPYLHQNLPEKMYIFYIHINTKSHKVMKSSWNLWIVVKRVGKKSSKQRRVYKTSHWNLGRWLACQQEKVLHPGCGSSLGHLAPPGWWKCKSPQIKPPLPPNPHFPCLSLWEIFLWDEVVAATLHQARLWWAAQYHSDNPW